ncbi:MAG: hypothetical protein V4723_03980 [Pseudomonadota bacterium]
MNTIATLPALAATMDHPEANRPAPQPSNGKDTKPVAVSVKLSAAEHAQLTGLRDTFRSAGHRVTKAKLLRAAVALINQQSSFKIEEQLQTLANLKKAPKKSERKRKK